MARWSGAAAAETRIQGVRPVLRASGAEVMEWDSER